MKSDRPPSDPGEGTLRLDALGEVEIVGRIGEGKRSTVYRARWRGRDAVLKVYKARAVVRHGEKHPQNLAAFEYNRNLAFFRAPGMERYVAEPLGYLATPGVAAFLQEMLDGELYYFYYRKRGGAVSPGLYPCIERLIGLCHAAGLYDADVHAMNVMVVEDEQGEPIPKLFDFNLIPFHVRAPNPFVALALKTGLMSRKARDLKRLRRFHDFRGLEAKLLKFYD